MDDHLAEKRYITLILRLAINEDEQFVNGELTDLGGATIGRFTDWPKLAEIIQTWITNQGVKK